MSSIIEQHHMARTYTRQEVGEFLALLDMPPEYRNLDEVSPNLGFLRTLHTHMISTVPYETLVLHYSPERRVRLDPQHLFQKIVRDSRGRGGYCLENNLFFLFMLRDLGFQVYPVGVKSRLRIDGAPKGVFQGWYVRVNSLQIRILSTNPVSKGTYCTNCYISRSISMGDRCMLRRRRTNAAYATHGRFCYS